jgi:hypothetical protein
VEVTEHEHNHCGQCWWEIRKRGEPQPSVASEHDIRETAAWQHGFLDSFRDSHRLPVLDASSSTDPCQVLLDWFSDREQLKPSAGASRQSEVPAIVTGEAYAKLEDAAGEIRGVLLEEQTAHLDAIAQRYNETSPEQRPLLMCAFFPNSTRVAFPRFGLPRPVPILPLLIRASVYVHRSDVPSPEEQVKLLTKALGKERIA